MVNPKLFTEFGRALERGDFDSLHPSDPDFIPIWAEQYDRCMNGYSVGGKWISGFLYAYVNFGTIRSIDEKTGSKKLQLPELRDIEFELDVIENECIKEEKGLLIIGPRRFGKSFKNSFRCVYTSIFLQDNSAVFAGREDKMLLSMGFVKQHLEGNLKNTQFYIPHKGNIKNELILGFDKEDPTIKKFVWKDYGASIYARNFNNNKHDSANGLSLKFALFDEIGIWPGLIESFNSSKPCWQDGQKWYGMPILVGTGGDMEKGTKEAREMFYNPEAFNLKSFVDPSNENKKTCLFVPGYYSVSSELRDEFGQVDKERAIKLIEDEREKLRKEKSSETFIKFLQYYPLKAEEAFLISSSNFFPSELIQSQIQELTLSDYQPQRGYLYQNVKNEIVFQEDIEKNEVSYPVDANADLEGCVVIYEHPYKINTTVPINLYIAGLDPYAQDESANSDSLGSLMIYKRFFDNNQSYDTLVAEYTGRPKTLNLFYEQVVLLLKYYNSKCLYENNIQGFKQYLEQRGMLYLLAPQPTIMNNVINDPKVDRKYGIHMTKEIKLYLANLLRSWILTEYAEGHSNIEKIKSVNLLREMLYFDFESNTDRVIAFMLALLQKEEEFRKKVIELSNKKSNMQLLIEHLNK
jgi:hypothetical protein